jgi:acetyl-CoA acyltransferase
MEPVYVCDAVRTPFGRYGGGLAGIRVDDLAALPIRALMARHPALDWARLDEVWLGCANQAGEDNRNVARMAVILAGLPLEVPAITVNRLCASGLDAIIAAARTIATGAADLVLAGGVEGMTRAPYVMGKADAAFGRSQVIEDTTMGWRFVNPALRARVGTETMPETAENLARELGIARADQDAYALRSQQRYARALERGFFAREIVSVQVPAGRGKLLNVEADEHPRPDATAEQLAKLRPVTQAEGTVTAGNASGINDGAAAVLLASADAVRRHGLTPRARFVAAASAGVEPRTMGIGPVPAIRRLLARTGLSLADIGLLEVNEAFAVQVLAVLRGLGLDDDSELANPNGGAIAIGHPLGASGARLVTTAVNAMAERGANRAICSLCVGVGQGVAALLERD